MELRNFIRKTIQEYRNETNKVFNDKKQLLYRGFSAKYGFLSKNNNSAIYFSPSLEYAKEYGDGNVITTLKPNNIFDVRNKNDFNVLKTWLDKKINEIIEEKEDEDGFLPKNIKPFIKDAKTYLKSDNPKDLMTAFSNISFSYFNGKNTVGVLEKLFMEENNIDYMYMFESGFLRTLNDELSIVFRNFPENYEIIDLK